MLFAIMTKVGIYAILRVNTLMFGGGAKRQPAVLSHPHFA
jgi:formate hydrogenlyase subunit 3/multisubunit Na+/H+ antiporter MnhD subunit